MEPDEGEEPDEDPSPSRVQRGRVLARLSFPVQRLPLSCLRVNLDITTLISCVSSLSHGGCFFSFREGVLTEQAAQERLSPVLPQLRAFMEGKQLFACSAAVTDFRLILETLGGPGEKQRGEQLLRSLTLMEDQPSQRSLNLTLSHKVTQRSVSIFGTGDSLRAVTMTANGRFVRAAANQGVRYNVFMHQPRALTEGKEWRATPL